MTPNKHGFQVNGTDPLYVSSFMTKSNKDIKFDTDTDKFVDHYKYWDSQIKIGNHTEGIVTPANPDLRPPAIKSRTDIKIDHDTDPFVDHYKYWNDQMRLGNYTNGHVTPRNPEMTPIKNGFKVNGTNPEYTSPINEIQKK